MLYLCRVKPLRHYLRGFLIAAWAGDKIAEFSFPEISFHFSLRPWFFFVSPAYAGKSPAAAYACPGTQDHPRVCGEKLYTPCVIAPSVGSPPRMREKARQQEHLAAQSGITPACAGKSREYRHHTAFSYDITAEQMGDWAEAMGIEAVYIDKDTQIRNFKNELKWNSMYYKLNK